MAPTALQRALVDGGIAALWGILTVLDTVLVWFHKLTPKVDEVIGSTTTNNNTYNTSSENTGEKKEPKKIVIVGASFAGLGAYRDLIRHSEANEISITVIDYKDYFEYNPGILRCFVDPSYLNELTSSLNLTLNFDGRGSKFVQGEVVEVNDKASLVTLKGGRSIPYDYLIVATGSTYPGPIKATPGGEATLTQRQTQINSMAQKVKDAQTICIVGAGAVGVELAGEIAECYPSAEKRIVMLDMSDTILNGFHPRSKEYCKWWLETNGVELKLGTALKSVDEKSATFQDGTAIEADIVFKCVGAAPASGFLKGGSSTSGGGLAEYLTGPKGSVVVNNYLQIEGYPNIFCAGDVCYHEPSNELKLGHTAHVNASLVALNVMKLVRAESGSGGLLPYPKGLYGNEATPKIANISLGKYSASLTFNGITVNGFLPAIVKFLIEWTQVAAAENRPVGLLFWVVADWSSFFIGRTILPTPVASPAIAAASPKSKKS